MNDFKRLVADNIVYLRTQRNMTQSELGQMLNYSDKSISKWERADAIPDAYVLKQMSTIFGVTVDWLLTAHDEIEKAAQAVAERPRKYSQEAISKVSVAGIWTLAALLFVLTWIAGGPLVWLLFVYAVPVSVITLLVFNSIWNNGKHNIWFVSILIWSVLATVYLTVFEFGHNTWQLLLLGIPAEIVVFFSFRIGRNANKK